LEIFGVHQSVSVRGKKYTALQCLGIRQSKRIIRGQRYFWLLLCRVEALYSKVFQGHVVLFYLDFDADLTKNEILPVHFFVSIKNATSCRGVFWVIIFLKILTRSPTWWFPKCFQTITFVQVSETRFSAGQSRTIKWKIDFGKYME
jgi:hypothetical protein